jgi:hypothetical protein
VWRRQKGCDLVPILCKPCKFIGSIYLNNCTVWSTLCDRYPDKGFDLVLSEVVGNSLNPPLGPTPALFNCDFNSISSQWFVDIRINGVNIPQSPFFYGAGLYNTPNCVSHNITDSYPCLNDWNYSLDQTLQQMISLGYDYRYEDMSGNILGYEDSNAVMVRIWDTNCSSTQIMKTITINVGVQFNIVCQTF